MRVQLLIDINEGRTYRATEVGADGRPTKFEILDSGKPKVSKRKTKATVELKQGAVLEMSDASAKKYIERGWAKRAPAAA